MTKGDIDAALACEWQALRAGEAEGDRMGVAASYLRIGDLLLRRGDGEQAGEMYRRSLHLSRWSLNPGTMIP